MLQDVGPGPERKHHAKHRQWQMAGVECMEVRALAHEHQRVLNGQVRPIGNMVIIQPSQKPCTYIYDGYYTRVNSYLIRSNPL